MTSQPKTDTLSEFVRRVNELWEESEQAGVTWDFTTCCCGEGLRLIETETDRKVVIY